MSSIKPSPKVVVVMPAYNAAVTLQKTIATLPKRLKLEVIVGDDASQDDTVKISRSLGLKTLTHVKNLGYGGNQKILYREALKCRADIIIMVHPDNQYDTTNLPKMIKLLSSGQVDIVLGTRMKTAHENHMPLWKHAANKFLTYCQNYFFKQHLSEYHTGLRAYRADVVRELPLSSFSDNFVFDSEFLAAAIARGFRIAETDTNCYYNHEVSSISFRASTRYGIETLRVLWRFRRGDYRA
jgi:glycosyltransferase involved in cell wall biosynthesis